MENAPRTRERTQEERDYYTFSAKVYSIFAPFYDAVTLPIRSLRRAVVRLSGAPAEAKVLDVATGTGAQARAFAARCREVVGIDLSEDMLRIASRKNRASNLRLLRADAAALPFGDAGFDVACVSFALHEMPRSVRETVVSEMARVTRPNGTIVVVDYALPRNATGRFFVYHLIKLFEREHYAEFVRSDLRALLDKNGVAIREERPALLGGARIVIGTKR